MQKNTHNQDAHGKPEAKIGQFYHQHHRMPSYAEVAKLLGYKTKSAAAYALRQLIDAGVIAKDKTGRLLPGRLMGETRLLGLVEAGFPSPAEEELADTINFDEYLAPNKESTYILRVKGESMIDAGIHEGDMVIVERRQTYKPGQIVIASVDGEYTIKYLKKTGDKYYLEPANAKFKPIYPKERLSIEAVVTGVVRKY
jgi:SOS regulatory protein LexA